MKTLRRAARRPSGTPVSVILLLVIAVLATGCDDSPTSLDDATPGELVLDVNHVHLESLQETFSIQARVLDLEGREMTNVPLTWSLEVPGVVESAGGSGFRSVSNGATTIHVAVADDYPHVGPDGYRSGKLAGSVGVTVQQRPVALGLSTSQSPGPGQTVVRLWSLGQSADLFGWTVDALGNPVSGVLGGVLWNSANSFVSQVGQGGEVIATGNGMTIIEATSAGMTGSVTVEVHAALDLTACVTVSGTAGSCGQESLTFAEEGY